MPPALASATLPPIALWIILLQIKPLWFTTRGTCIRRRRKGWIRGSCVDLHWVIICYLAITVCALTCVMLRLCLLRSLAYIVCTCILFERAIERRASKEAWIWASNGLPTPSPKYLIRDRYFLFFVLQLLIFRNLDFREWICTDPNTLCRDEDVVRLLGGGEWADGEEDGRGDDLEEGEDGEDKEEEDDKEEWPWRFDQI